MGRSCSVCSRPDAGAINERLAEGRSARSLAAELGLSHAAMLRHERNHTASRATPAPSGSPHTAPRLVGDPLDELTRALRVRALAGNPADTREYRLALAAQLDAKHATPPSRALEDEPEWIELRTKMLTALWPFPEARRAVADAIGEPE